MPLALKIILAIVALIVIIKVITALWENGWLQKVFVAAFSLVRLGLFAIYLYIPINFFLLPTDHIELFSKSFDLPTSTPGQVLAYIVYFDVGLSLISFINWIPLGKPWITPRLPIVPTFLVILLQTKSRHKMYYCETCQKNYYLKEIVAECRCCETEQKIRFMDITGRIYRKCKGKGCRQTRVMTFIYGKNSAKTRIGVFGIKRRPINLKCKNCGNYLDIGKVLNFGLYTGNEQLAKDYTLDFFYYTFGNGRKNHSFSANDFGTDIIDKINEDFEKGLPAIETRTFLDTISFQLDSLNKVLNSVRFQFHTAISGNENRKLRSCEGITLLFDANSSNYERESTADQFLVDLQQLNTRSSVWENPVYVGLCANGCKDLESQLDDIAPGADTGEMCRNFLNAQNNADIINKLSGAIKNLHFFIYRTGKTSDNTEDRISNAVEPEQTLLLAVCPELRNIF